MLRKSWQLGLLAALIALSAQSCSQSTTEMTVSAQAQLQQRFPGTTGPLSIGSITPDKGLDSIKTIVSIAGTGFTPGTEVTIDGTPCGSVVVATEKFLGCVAQPHASGAVDVTLTNPSGETTTLAGGFTYHKLGQ